MRIKPSSCWGWLHSKKVRRRIYLFTLLWTVGGMCALGVLGRDHPRYACWLDVYSGLGAPAMLLTATLFLYVNIIMASPPKREDASREGPSSVHLGQEEGEASAGDDGDQTPTFF